MSNKYRIEQKILTLAKCGVMKNTKEPSSFEVADVKFSHWSFSYSDGWTSNAWLATATIEAEDYRKARVEFKKKLNRLIPRIALISQSYTDYLLEPYMIHKIGSDAAFFAYTEPTSAFGLMFREKEQKALEILINDGTIPDAFYYYWNDAVNAIGYSAKLLLMFSAIEALVKKIGGKNWKNLRRKMLGASLDKNLFEKNNRGLRHRLVHGEYFGGQDDGKNYLELVHNKVIKYFNDKIFQESLIYESQIPPQNPHRHFFGDKSGYIFFLKTKTDEHAFNLKDLLDDFPNIKSFASEKYEHEPSINVEPTY